MWTARCLVDLLGSTSVEQMFVGWDEIYIQNEIHNEKSLKGHCTITWGRTKLSNKRLD